MKQAFLKLERWTTGFSMLVACLMLVIASALGLFQIVTRFVLEQPAEWSEILIRLSLIWMVFMGIPMAFRQGAMVSVDVLYRWSPPRIRRALDRAELLIVLGARGPEIFLEPMPAGPLLTGLKIGFAQIELGIKIAKGLGHGLDALPVRTGNGIKSTRLIVLARLVRGHEFGGHSDQLLSLVLDVLLIVLVRLLDQLHIVSCGTLLLTGISDREGGADAVADHARFACRDVAPGLDLQHQLPRYAGADILHFADDAQSVLAVEVELVHLAAAVRHREGEGS